MNNNKDSGMATAKLEANWKFQRVERLQRLSVH